MTITRNQRTESASFYEVSSDETLSEAVVAAVADASDREMVPGKPATEEDAIDPLYAAIDPDALDSLFESVGGDAERSCGQVTFAYDDYEVTVYSAGSVLVEPR